MEICTQQSFQFVQDLFIYGKTIQLRERCRNDIAACQHGARLQRPWISDGFSTVWAVDGAVAQGENGQILFRAALHAGEHLRCFSADCDRPQFEDAPDQAEVLFSAADGVHRHVQKVQHLGFIVSFLAEIFGQFQKIKAVINAGLHLRQVEEVFFNVCAGEGVAVTALVNLKLAEDERIGDGHQRAFHAAGAAREGGDFAELPGQDHDALVILSDRGADNTIPLTLIGSRMFLPYYNAIL